jgi:hypothetical protein
MSNLDLHIATHKEKIDVVCNKLDGPDSLLKIESCHSSRNSCALYETEGPLPYSQEPIGVCLEPV